MRGINVPRRRSPYLPWLVGAVILLALLWVVSGLTDGDLVEALTGGDVRTATGVPVDGAD